MAFGEEGTLVNLGSGHEAGGWWEGSKAFV